MAPLVSSGSGPFKSGPSGPGFQVSALSHHARNHSDHVCRAHLTPVDIKTHQLCWFLSSSLHHQRPSKLDWTVLDTRLLLPYRGFTTTVLWILGPGCGCGVLQEQKLMSPVFSWKAAERHRSDHPLASDSRRPSCPLLLLQPRPVCTSGPDVLTVQGADLQRKRFTAADRGPGSGQIQVLRQQHQRK
ncbi:hypothetical protein Q8A73_020687 [Channa argus]|nr:hypothetical protein Q8A73_020687 [Channa argus]